MTTGFSADAKRPPPAAGTAVAIESRPSFLDRLWSGADEQERADTLPRFTASASDEVETGNDSAANRRRIALRDTMSASQPVTDRETFAGRHDALRQLINAVEQQRMHVVIYGERGIGKTSLAHVFAETAREARYLVLYSSCGADTKFDVLFRSFAARLPRLYHRSILPNSADAESGGNFDSMLSDDFGPRELADLFAEVTATRVVLILDEFDRVNDQGFRRDVAELIKNLSDRGSRVQLILTGVAQNLDELLGYAPSIRRNIVGLPLRPMSPAEVTDLIGIGEKAAELEFSKEAIEMIAAMSAGSPYVVRLLTHQAGLIAIDNRSALVSETHARAAVERVLTDWNSSLPRRVQINLGRDEVRQHWPMLIAAARAGTTADGFFSPEDVVAELENQQPVDSVERQLKTFAGPNDLLESEVSPGFIRFRFRYAGVSALLMMSSAMTNLAS